MQSESRGNQTVTMTQTTQVKCLRSYRQTLVIYNGRDWYYFEQKCDNFVIKYQILDKGTPASSFVPLAAADSRYMQGLKKPERL